jgi:hypothetical protein
LVLVEDGAVSLGYEIAAVPPYLCGWLVGVVARGLAFLRDAIVAGYRAGRGL